MTRLSFPWFSVGQGARLFLDAGPDIALDLVDSRADSKGVTIQVYRPTGRLQARPAGWWTSGSVTTELPKSLEYRCVPTAKFRKTLAR